MDARGDRLGGAGREPVGSSAARIKGELGPMLTLAVPVVVAELGWMAMGIVDTILVRSLGAEATGAVGLGGNLFIAVVIFGIGLLLGLDAMVAREYGAGRLDEARQSLAQGIYLTLGITPILMGIIRILIQFLPRWDLLDEVLVQTIPYLEALSWSTLPLLIFAALRRYLQAIDVVKPITFALVSANVVNAVACYGLVHGAFGLPRLGVEGAGWATGLARVYMMAVLVVSFAIWGSQLSAGVTGRWVNPFRGWPRFEPARFGRLVQFGWPAALQLGLEVGVFSAATALAGRLDAVSLAAHQIVLNVSSLTFMVPLGIATAGAVRVGQALGRGDHPGAATSGWTALLIGAGFMMASGLGLLIFGRTVAAVFSDVPEVVNIAARLFLLAAAFQLFDGIQVVATGVLRGVGDTRNPMICNLVAHWGVGLPIGYALAFGMNWGIMGLWVGLSIGLTLAGMVNLATWAYRARHLDRVPPLRVDEPISDSAVALGPPGVS